MGYKLSVKGAPRMVIVLVVGTLAGMKRHIYRGKRTKNKIDVNKVRGRDGRTRGLWWYAGKGDDRRERYGHFARRRGSYIYASGEPTGGVAYKLMRHIAPYFDAGQVAVTKVVAREPKCCSMYAGPATTESKVDVD